MRCLCCNRNLNDYESTLRSVSTGDFTDMCMSCLDGLDIPTLGRSDLDKYAPTEDDDFVDDDGVDDIENAFKYLDRE